MEGNIRFEGEYSNGKKNGKCKEYDRCGRNPINVEYLNGEFINYFA